jgi:predicted nucleic acid-binding Zn ribbon protein
MVEDHRHCLGCGRAIAKREQFCSAECEATFIISAQKERRRNLLFLILLAMFMSLLFIIQIFYG